MTALSPPNFESTFMNERLLFGTDEFVNLVESLCNRPRMCTIGGTFEEVAAYVFGYVFGACGGYHEDESYEAFQRFVCAKFRFPSNYVWAFVIRECQSKDEDAIECLRSLVSEFATKSKSIPFSEIVEDAHANAVTFEEGEPEKVWRRFAHALLSGNRDTIEPLILEHPDAWILWEGKCPEDVAELLDEIAESYPVTRIAGREEDGEVTIITHDFGPMKIRLLNGSWRVDAAKVIETTCAGLSAIRAIPLSRANREVE
jgi:hypothetical protein